MSTRLRVGAVLVLLAWVALIAAVAIAPPASAGGSDAPTPYTVTSEGVQLPDGVTFPAHGHVNYRTTLRSGGVHFDPNNNQPGGVFIGASFFPIDLAPGECITWVQVSIYNEHFGEGGQQPVCKTAPTPTPSPLPSSTPEPSPTATPTPEPTQEPTWSPTPEPTPEPSTSPTSDPSPSPTTPDPSEPSTPSPSPTSPPSSTPSPSPTPTGDPTTGPSPSASPEPSASPVPSSDPSSTTPSVTASSTPSPALSDPTRGELARTGGAGLLLGAVALVLTGIGVLTVVVTRRQP